MCSRPGDPRGPGIIVPEPRHLERQLGRVATASRLTLVELVGSGMILDARGDTTRRTSVHRGRAPLHEVVARASRKTLVQVYYAIYLDEPDRETLNALLD